MSVKDVPLNVVRLGEGGVPLLMLHGWAHSLENLRGLGELLSQDRAVHLIDLPGFGQSGVPTEVLVPRNTWVDKAAYDKKANELASKFNANFDKYREFADAEMVAAAPKVLQG